MGDVNIPISADFDTSSTDRAIDEFREGMNRLAKSVADANKTKFEPVSAATLDDLKQVVKQFEQLKRINGGLSDRLRQTGQSGSSPFGLDFGRMYDNPAVRAQRMLRFWEYVTAGTRFGSGVGRPDEPAPAPGGGSAPPPHYNPGWWRRIVGAGLRGAGGGGAALNAGLEAGGRGGFGLGLKVFGGELAARAVGAVVGAIAGKVGDVQREMIGYDTLKRSVGDVGVSFDGLKDTLRGTARAMHITYDESLNLAQSFARVANVTGGGSLAASVALSTGFARSYGINPQESAVFFGRMAQFGVARGGDQSRQFALQIGEAIARSGAFAKTGEMLSAITNYTTQQTRLGLSSANALGYASMMTGLLRSGVPGLANDPTGVANLLGTINSSIQAGGRAGEAGQMFLYRALGASTGLDPIRTQMLWEQGAFGMQGGKTNFQRITALMRRIYPNSMWGGRGAELRWSAMHRLLGISINQAQKIDSVSDADIGALARYATANHIDISGVGFTAISPMAQALADKRLTPAARLARIRALAAQGQSGTLGTTVRNAQTDMSNLASSIISPLIGPINDIKGYVAKIADKIGATAGSWWDAGPRSGMGGFLGGGTRAQRNHNPGNIEFGAFARQFGATGSDGRFAQFPSDAAGAAAMGALIRRKYAAGLNTIRRMYYGNGASDGWLGHGADLARQGPASVAAVSRMTGLSPDALLSPEQLAIVQRAMMRQEGFFAAQSPREITHHHVHTLVDQGGRRIPAVSTTISSSGVPTPAGY